MKSSRLLVTGLVILGAAGLIGQTGREAYRQTYGAWRQAHANLERDAGTGGTALLSQVDRAASAAASFEASRASYLKSAAQDAAQRRQVLQIATTRPPVDLAPAVAALVDRESQTVTRTIARFANDPDRGIQQLRQSLERERDALAALNQAIQVRQKTVAATSQAAEALEPARSKTAGAFGDQTSQLSEAVAQMEKEGAAWGDYYEKLAQAIQVANAPSPRVNITPVTPRPDSVTPVPMTRFVGAWTYPMVNGVFHGAQPEFVDLVIHEQNGHADGTLFGRFKLASGSAADPLVRFDFQGDFRGSGSQRFPLVTSDGTQGTVELIPGPAFNLLEVNFQTVPRPNKIAIGNFILMKK
ncbi:MAG: hypothetical protein JWO19_1488 [Bryobacterales bacterium]|nr:hypothetical protein [Bryobacterales bacterium]